MTTLPSVPLRTQPALIATFVASGALTTINIMLISPLLKPIAADFDMSDSTAGQLSTLTAVSAFVTALLVAPLMDRYSLRMWLRLEAVLVAVGALLSALAPTFAVLLFGRAAAGVGSAVILGICFAAAAEMFSETHQRNRVIGLITTAAILGPMIGLPLLTLTSDQAGWRWAFVILFPLCGIVLMGSRTFQGTSTPSSGERGWLAEYRRILSLPGVLAQLSSAVFICLIRFGWLIYLGAYAETVFSTSATTLSLVFLVGGTAQVIANNAVPWLLRYYSPLKIATVASVITAVNLFAVGVVYTERWMIFPFIIVGSVAWSASIVPQSIILIETMPSALGAVNALRSAAFELGIALAAAVAGGTLAVLDDYEATFRVLGLFVPIMIGLLAIGVRQSTNRAIHTDITAEPVVAEG